jgi:hypothetical protein
LRDQVWETAIRRGGMSVILGREAEVTGRDTSSSIERELTASDEFDDRE